MREQPIEAQRSSACLGAGRPTSSGVRTSTQTSMSMDSICGGPNFLVDASEKGAAGMAWHQEGSRDNRLLAPRIGEADLNLRFAAMLVAQAMLKSAQHKGVFALVDGFMMFFLGVLGLLGEWRKPVWRRPLSDSLGLYLRVRTSECCHDEMSRMLFCDLGDPLWWDK
mmetsp:Transcript_40664/g.92383  ORF Transcript_40664/g.92383 Transcript_40664/m.92383 type:complete len:167 (-) Transcript_40664:2-502(-)